jgi:2-hydroxychromene-2-carboxylate isomerase
MSKSFDFYFDFGSPASYLAWTQLPALAAATGAQVGYQPMLLGGVFQATGNQSPVMIPAKGRYTFTDFDRHARRYGVVLNLNPFFPVNTLLLMRGATGLLMRDEARFLPYCNAMFKGLWVDAQNMGDPATVGKVLAGAGFDPAALLALANEQAVKDRLKAVTQDAVRRGVFGAPTFFVGEQMFWGQDRLEWVREALAA